MVDRLINIAKTRPPHVAIRSINRVVTDKNASRKIMEVLKERYRDRSSGLTRAVPVGSRKGDGAELVDLSLVEGRDVPDVAVDAGKKITKRTKETPHQPPASAGSGAGQTKETPQQSPSTSAQASSGSGAGKAKEQPYVATNEKKKERKGFLAKAIEKVSKKKK